MAFNVALILNLLEQMFQMAHLTVMEVNCAKLFWNPSTVVEVMDRQYSDAHKP